MLRAVRSASGHEWLVKAPGALHGREAAQSIAKHEGARFEVALGPSGDLIALERADAAQAHPHRAAPTMELHCRYERRLARRPSPVFAPAAQRLRGLERGHGRGGNRDALARAGISSLPLGTALDREGPEPGDVHRCPPAKASPIAESSALTALSASAFESETSDATRVEMWDLFMPVLLGSPRPDGRSIDFP